MNDYSESPGEHLWETQGDNLRAPILPIPLARHLITLAQAPMAQAQLLSFYAGARNHSAMGSVIEYLATYDLPLLLELEQRQRRTGFLDGWRYLNQAFESKHIQGKPRRRIGELQRQAASLESMGEDSFDYNPFESVIDNMAMPVVIRDGEEWSADVSSHACSIIATIALHQNHLRFTGARTRGGFSPEELDGACSPEDCAALARICSPLVSITSYGWNVDDTFQGDPHRESIYGGILSRVGSSLLDLLPLARLAEEYNMEWAVASFDWDVLGNGERLPLPFLPR